MSNPKIIAESQFSVPEIFQLANGMDIVVIPDHRAPIVTHMVWYRVGSADETLGKTGLAHFLEHLMFKGTEKIASGQFSKIVARNGGQSNAFTNYDFTAFYQAITKDRLPLMMEMEADRMTHLKLVDKDILSERDIVIEELRMRIENAPLAELRSKMNAMLYGGNMYGRDVIGSKMEIQKLDIDSVLDFYRRFYTPSNAILIVVGDVTAVEIKLLAEKYFGVIAKSVTKIERRRPPIIWPTASKRIVLHDSRIHEESWIRFYPAPSNVKAGARQRAAMNVLAQILGGGTTSRLYQALVVRNKQIIDVRSWYEGDQLEVGRFGIYALPIIGSTSFDTEKAIDIELAAFLSSKIDIDELQRAKSQLISSMIYAHDAQQAVAYDYGSNLTTGLTATEVYQWPDYIRAVTSEDVLNVANKVLDASHAVTGELLPSCDKL